MAAGVQMIPFVGGSYAPHARFISAQRTVNFVPEVTGPDARVDLVLAPTPGETVVKRDFANGQPCRGLHWSSTGPDGQPCLWGVFGTKVYRWSSIDDDPVEIPDEITAGSGRVSIADNGYVLAIADGSILWAVDLTAADGSLALKTADLPEAAGETVRPSIVEYIASRFVINDTNPNAAARNIFLFSNLNAQMPGSGANEISFAIPGTSPEAPQYYSAEYSADPIVSMVVNEGRLWLLGPNSYEAWAPGANSDTGSDPFDWVSGATADIGTQAPGSLAQIADYVFWLGGSSTGRNGVYMVKVSAKSGSVMQKVVKM